MHPNGYISAQLPPERFQLLPSLSYYIRRLLRENLQSFQLPSYLKQSIDPLDDLNAALAFLYPDLQEINTVVLELEKLILSYQTIRVDEDDHHPGLQAIQREVLWWLGYEVRSDSAHTILVVDDVAENTILISGILESKGYRVYSASNGEMALHLLQEIHPNLILLDIRMPGMDGYQVLQTLQQTVGIRLIPVILLSALETVEEQQKALALGAVGFIPKPFRMAFLLEQVQHHLGHPSSPVDVSASRIETRRSRARHIPCLLRDLTKAGFQATLDGRYLRVNTRFARLCGYASTTAMISEVINLWDQIYCNSFHQDRWSRCIAHPNQLIQFEPQIRHRDGRILQALEQVQAVQDAYGHFLLYEGFIEI